MSEVRHWATRTAGNQRLRDVGSALFLALFVLLLFGRLLFTNRVLASGDILHYFYPYRDFAAAALRGHETPYWNPYIFLGAPFLANPQAAVLYPLHWPLSWLTVTKQIYWSAALHAWILALGGYVLMRSRCYSRTAALMTGLVLAGSGFYGGLIGHINQMNGAAWLPWLVLLIDGGMRRSTPAAWLARTAGFGLLTALMLLAGHTQTAYINLFGVGVWAIFPLLPFPGRSALFADRRTEASGVAIYAGGVLLGALLSMAQLLPTLELSALGLRSGGLSYGEATSFSLQPLRIFWTLLPSYGLADLSVVFSTLGYTEFVAYIGFAGLALATAGALFGRRGRFWVLGLLFVLLGLFLAAGRWNPAYYVLYKVVPGFDLFRTPARWMMLYTFGGAVLAGVGVEALRRYVDDRGERHPLRWLAVGTALLVAGELLLAARALPHTQPTAPQAVYDIRTAPAFLRAEAEGQVHPAAAGRFLSMSSLTFDPGDMTDYRRIFLERSPPQLTEKAFADFVIAQKSQEILAPNLPLFWRIPAVDGFDGGVLPLQRYLRFLSLFLPAEELVADGRLREQVTKTPDTRLLALMNARYLVTDKLRDLWFDDVYYDRQIGLRLDAGEQAEHLVEVPAPLEATHVDLIGYVDGTQAALQRAADRSELVARVELLEADTATSSLPLYAGGAPGAHFADGALDSAMAQSAGATVAFEDVEQGGQEYRARQALPTPLAPTGLRITSAGTELDVVIQAATLYDARTGMFAALLPSDRGRFRRVHSGDVKVYENLDVLPRAYLVNSWRVVDQPSSALAQLAESDFDPAREAVVEASNLLPPPRSAGSTGDPDSTSPATPETTVGDATVGDATITDYGLNGLSVHVATAAPALLVVSDSHYPGWTATLNGEPVPIYVANALFRGVFVPPGEHVVDFEYSPTQWRLGLWISLVGLVILLAMLLGALILRRR